MLQVSNGTVNRDLSYLRPIDTVMGLLLIEEELQTEEEEGGGGIPIRGANLTSPVVDTAYYIDEIHYKIGNRLYIENAD